MDEGEVMDSWKALELCYRAAVREAVRPRRMRYAEVAMRDGGAAASRHRAAISGVSGATVEQDRASLQQARGSRSGRRG
jgi:hypothetical protein